MMVNILFLTFIMNYILDLFLCYNNAECNSKTVQNVYNNGYCSSENNNNISTPVSHSDRRLKRRLSRSSDDCPIVTKYKLPESPNCFRSTEVNYSSVFSYERNGNDDSFLKKSKLNGRGMIKKY